VKICSTCSWLHLLKSWSLLKTRGGSDNQITIGLGFNLNAKEDVRIVVIDALLGQHSGTGTAVQIKLEREYRKRLNE